MSNGAEGGKVANLNWKGERTREKKTEDRGKERVEENKQRQRGRKKERQDTHLALCFFLHSHIRTVFCIMMQALARYRILFFTVRDRNKRLSSSCKLNL